MLNRLIQLLLVGVALSPPPYQLQGTYFVNKVDPPLSLRYTFTDRATQVTISFYCEEVVGPAKHTFPVHKLGDGLYIVSQQPIYGFSAFKKLFERKCPRYNPLRASDLWLIEYDRKFDHPFIDINGRQVLLAHRQSSH